MSFSVLSEKMLIFVVLMAMGYVFARTKYVSDSFVKDASKLVLNVFTPATILYSVLDSNMSTEELFASIAAMTVMILISYAVGFAAVKLLRVKGKTAATFELLISTMNTMFIALPVAEQLYGSKAVFFVSISCLPTNFVLYSYGIWRFTGNGQGSKFDPKKIFSVQLVATVIAIVLFLVKPPIPGAAKELLKSLSGVTMPLSMFVVGASLASVGVFEAFKEKTGYITSFFRLIVCPALVYLVLRLFISDPVLLKTTVITAAAPSGVIVTILSVQYDKDYVFSSKGILLCTILSMFVYPLWALILG